MSNESGIEFPYAIWKADKDKQKP